jgi:hypothetical protein
VGNSGGKFEVGNGHGALATVGSDQRSANVVGERVSARQWVGRLGARASNQTPPMPRRQASQAPTSEGDRGTSSRKWVGRVPRESAKERKSEAQA